MNGRVIKFDIIGELVYLPILIYYNPKSIVLIISLHDVLRTRGTVVEMNSKRDESKANI